MEDALLNSNSESKGDEARNGKQFVTTIISIVVVLALGVLTVYFVNFNGAFGTQADFGAFGDFLGGILNPILSFATLSLLIWSINIQIGELKATTAEFKRSAAAQEAIDKNQKQELEFYKRRGELEFVLSELVRLENQKTEILEYPYFMSDGYPIKNVLTYGLLDHGLHLEKVMDGFNYNGAQHDEDHLPIIHIITDFISFTNDYDYYLEQLFVKKEYELYIMKVHTFAAFLEKLSATKLGTKIQLNGLATRIDTRNTQLPDLNDDRLNGLRTYVAEKVINIHKLAQSIPW